MGTVVEKIQYIEGTKEAIKKAIKNKGVDVSDTDTFRSYAEKIKEIGSGGGGGGSDTFEARNDLGVTEIAEGTKVLVQPLGLQSSLEEKFSDSSQKQNWGGLCLYPSVQTMLMCDIAYSYGGCGLYSWNKEDGLSEIYTATANLGDYSDTMYNQGIKFLSKNLVIRFTNTRLVDANNMYYWTPNAVVTSNANEYILNDGYGIKNASSTIWTLWKVSEDGEFLEQVAQSTSGFDFTRYYNLGYVSPNGQYVIVLSHGVLFKNENGNLVKVDGVTLSLNQILGKRDSYNVLGGTYDGKYMIVNSYFNTPDSRGINNFPAIIKISDDYQTYSEYKEFDITGLPTWYPWLQTLCVKNAQGVVRMFKYVNGEWEEISIDFPDTFTSGQDGRVTLNYDGTQICVTDSQSYNTGAVYLYDLEFISDSYKAVPSLRRNFNTHSYTAYATGNITANTVEVNALLPTLDDMEYDDGIVIKPSVIPGIETE